MPVGKNSIKRVTNNGYSHVTTAAPDMENSTVIANPTPEVLEMVAPKKKPTAKKPTAKKPTAKKPTAKKPELPTPVSNNEEKIEVDDGFTTFTLGEDLPYYLL